MLINYTYKKAIKVFTLWLSKALLCPKRKGPMQQLWVRMEARQIAPAFNLERMVQYFALVFKGFTSSCNSSGNKGSQATYFACFNLCKKQFSERYSGYLKRRLSAKGGIRKERLPLYLAEYVWKYNHRNDSIDLQKKLILQQLGRCHV